MPHPFMVSQSGINEMGYATFGTCRHIRAEGIASAVLDIRLNVVMLQLGIAAIFRITATAAGPHTFTGMGTGGFLQDLFLEIVVIVGLQYTGHKEVAASAADRIRFPFFRAVGFFYV